MATNLAIADCGPPNLISIVTPADANFGIGIFQLTTFTAPAPGSPLHVVKVDDEIIYYSVRIGGDFSQPVPAVRAREGTALKAHALNTFVYDVFTLEMLERSARIASINDNSTIDFTRLTYPPVSFFVTPPVADLKSRNRTVNFVDGSTPAEVEDGAGLGYPINDAYLVNFQSWYGTELGGIVTKFKPNPIFFPTWDETNQRLDLVIEASHSEYGDLTPQFRIPRGFGGTTAFTLSEDNFPKPTGYVAGSYNYGWGNTVIPPYDTWWVYLSSNTGSAHGVYLSALSQYPLVYQNPLVAPPPALNRLGWLESGPSTLETEVINSAYGQLPVSHAGGADPFVADYELLDSSCTTMRLHYTPGPTTSYARSGVCLMEISSRHILAFGQELGSTMLHLWSHTTMDDDSLNSFAPIDSVDCGLLMDDIFLRIYVDIDGSVKFLYSADNCRFYEAFSWADTSAVFNAAPCRVGFFMFHNRSYPTYSDLTHNTNFIAQNGSMNCSHYEQKRGSGIDPVTYHPTLIGTTY